MSNTDLLGVPDAIVWKYGETLRAMAAEYKSIKFARLVDLIKTKSISSGLVAAMNEDEYEEQAPLVRAELIAAYGDQTFDVADQIASNPNVKATYLGYIRFLMKDLAYSSVDGTSSDSTTSSDSMADPYFPPSASGKESDSNSIGSRRSQKKRASKVAKQMLFRGDVYLLLHLLCPNQETDHSRIVLR